MLCLCVLFVAMTHEPSSSPSSPSPGKGEDEDGGVGALLRGDPVWGYPAGAGSPFFALPTGIADLEESERSLYSGGGGVEDGEEDEDDSGGEAFGMSSGEEGQDFASLFTPPSKKYEALRNQNGTHTGQSLWSFYPSSHSPLPEYVLFVSIFFARITQRN